MFSKILHFYLLLDCTFKVRYVECSLLIRTIACFKGKLIILVKELAISALIPLI